MITARGATGAVRHAGGDGSLSLATIVGGEKESIDSRAVLLPPVITQKITKRNLDETLLGVIFCMITGGR
jgi:hypothetical protein